MEPVRILLVEDNIGDVVLTREALAGYPVPVKLSVANDGEAAMSMMARRDLNLDLIILDLNMPRMDGNAVLERSPKKGVPVIIFSSTQNPSEIERALSLGAREFIRKPLGFYSYADAVRGIVDRWRPAGRPAVPSLPGRSV